MAKTVYLAVLPCLLIVWALGAATNVSLPIYGTVPIGYAYIVFAALLIASGIWRSAQGRPGFFVVPYPFHAGAVSLTVGVSMVLQSGAGLWLLTPIVAITAALAATVGGLETPRILPPDDDRRPTTLEGVRFLFVVIIPWLAIFEFTSHMRLPGTAFRFPFEDHLPVYVWTAIIYETSYLTVTFAPAWTRTNRQLRQLMVTSWVAIAIVYPIYWLMPSAAPRRPMVDNSLIAHLLMRERTGVAPTAAFPSFHVLWAIFVGRLWPRWMWISYSVLIAISCITTGMHYIPDVLAAFALSPLFLEPGRLLWRPLVKLCARIGKWRAEWPLVYTAIAAFAIVAVASSVAVREWHVLVVAFTGLAGLVVASGRREWGLWGAWAGVALASLFFEERWNLLAAGCLCAPFIQAVNRAARWPSAVIANVFLGLVLLRLFAAGQCPLSILCGVYAIGAGLIHAAERSREIGVALAIIALGVTLTTLASPVAPKPVFTSAGLLEALLFSFACTIVFAYTPARAAVRTWNAP